MKKSLFILFYLLFIFGCSSKSTNNERLLNLSKATDYEDDKRQIANCFLVNIEFFRKYHRYDMKLYVNSSDSLKRQYAIYYKKYPGAERDPANFFEAYASRYSLETEEYVNSPFQSKEQMSVTVDTIIYNEDKLFCIAFAVINLHYDEVEGLESKREKGREFDALAVIGYRESINSPFNIYPLTKHKAIGFESFNAAAKMLKDLYFNHLKGKGSAGTVYEGLRFKHNVGDNYFFSNSPYFQKHKSGNFNFQMYRYRNEDLLYKYFDCND